MNSDELFTRCPTCRTVYRTHDAQLSLQAGKVRCGQCRMVFDGRAHLVDLMPDTDAEARDETAYGPPTVTLRELAPAPARDDETGSSGPRSTHAHADPDEQFLPAAQHDPETAPADTGPDSLLPSASAAPAEMSQSAEDVVPYGWQEPLPDPRPRGMRWALGIAAALLVVLLAGQAVYQFRHVIAANYPQFQPALAAACAALGCSVEPVRSRDEITIESHDLQADPAHQGLLILQVTLRNRANNAVAFPYLELEIIDLGSQPLVRRAFAPVEYAGGAADFTRGMPAGAEWNIKLFIDASSINARGYNLDLFYP